MRPLPTGGAAGCSFLKKDDRNLFERAAIAQLVERLICNQQVGSSTLSGGCGQRAGGVWPDFNDRTVVGRGVR